MPDTVIDMASLTREQIEEYKRQGYKVELCLDVTVTRTDGTVETIGSTDYREV